MRIIFASQNKHKIEEIKAILKDVSVQIVSLNDLKDEYDVEETGSTFKENSYLKAKYFFEKYKLPCIADDSGLVIPSLNNEPGVYSARYAGVHGDDYANNLLVLNKLNGNTNRDAYFVSTICYINILGEVLYFEGILDGVIDYEMKGKNGFGYDPLFSIPRIGKTMAEVPNEVKNSLSHRFLALTKLTNHLKKEAE